MESDIDCYYETEALPFTTDTNRQHQNEAFFGNWLSRNVFTVLWEGGKRGVYAIPMILLRGGRLTPHVACESIIKRCLLPKAYFYLLDSIVYVFNKGGYTSEIDRGYYSTI